MKRDMDLTKEAAVKIELFKARKLFLVDNYKGCLTKLVGLTIRARKEGPNSLDFCRKLGKECRKSLGLPGSS